VSRAPRSDTGTPSRSWLLALATIALLVVSPAHAQISPGALSRSHEDLDSPLSCFKCHGGGEDDLNDRCLTCHQEISWLAANGRGLHGRAGNDRCGTCHVEHAGREASLARFDEGSPDRFDHAKTGWPLTGKHASTKCVDCHKVEFRKSEAARLSKRKNPETGYIGLETECASCHADPHRGTQGQDCRSCHLTTAWNATPGFDHAKTAYPLTGKHAPVACEKCHRQTTAMPAGSTTPPKIFKPLAHAQCSDCHRDVHQGRAGPSCSSCHVTESFRRVENNSFDHARTGYPLEGRHLRVGCERCHRQNVAAGPAAGAREAGAVRRLPHERCVDCHADAHGGQLANRPEGSECAPCHRVQGWTPSTFTVEQHAALEFDLEGRHATAQCSVCHAPQSKGPALSMPAETLGSARVALALGVPACVSCHADPHDGRFAAGRDRVQEQGCRGCHGVDAFRPSTLLASDHARLGFSLEGAHGTVTCDRCHKEIRPLDSMTQATAAVQAAGDAASPLLFPAERSCEACHEGKNPHGIQFATRRDNGACESCHDERAFRLAPRFNHDRHTRFPLLRSHGDVACLKCHEKQPGPSGEPVVVYKPTTFDCKECHRRTAPELPQRATRFSTTETTSDNRRRRR
jgi:hypothetical protein